MAHRSADSWNRRGLVLAVACAAIAAGDPLAAGMLVPRATDLAAKYENVTLVLGTTRRIAFGTHTGTVLLLENRNGSLVEVSRRYLWSPVQEIVAVDLDGNGQDELVGSTQDGRLFVLQGTDLADIWNTPEKRYQSIRAVTAADVDRNGRGDIVFIADDRLRVYQGMRDVLIWESTTIYQDNEIAIGDVDGDGRTEIVLNISGRVLDAEYREVEWQYDAGFGVEIDLYDVDQDGRLEIIGLGADGLLRIFDVDERRVKVE